MKPVRPVRGEEQASFGGRRLAQILGYTPFSPGPIAAVSDDLDISGTGVDRITHTAMYIDATAQTPVYVSGGTTAIHVLWTAPGTRAELLAGLDPYGDTELAGFHVHPGDTMSISAGVPYALGAGILAFVFASGPAKIANDPAAWSAAQVTQPPHHGLNLFRRFNRRTICAAHHDVLLERWKISHPLDLTLNPQRWHYLTNLVEPVALNWPGGSTILGRTESRFLPAGLNRMSIVPNGLGYVLIGSMPDLAQDVVDPLRRAGYERSAIATLGVPVDSWG